jgi:hypothetical protein
MKLKFPLLLATQSAVQIHNDTDLFIFHFIAKEDKSEGSVARVLICCWIHRWWRHR